MKNADESGNNPGFNRMNRREFIQRSSAVGGSICVACHASFPEHCAYGYRCALLCQPLEFKGRK